MKPDRRVDFVVSLPGPAEALIPVIAELKKSLACRVIGLSTHARYPGIGGSLPVLRRVFPETIDLAASIGPGDGDLGPLMSVPSDLLVLGAVDDLGRQLSFPEKDVLRLSETTGVTTVQFIDNWFAWPASATMPDHLFVIDDLAERIGRHFCPEATSFFVVGHPGLQQFHRSMSGAIGGSASAGHICYFTQLDVDTAQTLEWLSQILGERDSLIIKKHPRDRMSYEEGLARFNCKAAVVDESPEALFSTIGQTITHTSVVGLKSAVLSIPTINVNPRAFMPEVYDLVGGYPLSIAGFSQEVSSLEELGEAVRNPRVVDPKDLTDHFHFDDARERFVGRIVELIR